MTQSNYRTSTSRFADVAHQCLTFDREIPSEKLILDLLESKWVQRLRQVRQTGNTNLVYMFSEHSRFGHSLGVAYLALLLMKNLNRRHSEKIDPWKDAVAVAALLHDIGHTAPGSHLAERIWFSGSGCRHEETSARVIAEDSFINKILRNRSKDLPEMVQAILLEDSQIPPWTHEVISGGGWNADRGNWAIVDSAMCSVSYGRYNVIALLDSFLISPKNHLIIHENRLDALTHFYLARDSMYRQVYQHRVLLVADMLVEKIIERVKSLIGSANEPFLDNTLKQVLSSSNSKLDLEIIFKMTESWWSYHLNEWCFSSDPVLKDFATRLRDRNLFKTIRLHESDLEGRGSLIQKAKIEAEQLGYDPKYYVQQIGLNSSTAISEEKPPNIMLDSGEIISASTAEPLIGILSSRPVMKRKWLSVPQELKQRLGRTR